MFVGSVWMDRAGKVKVERVINTFFLLFLTFFLCAFKAKPNAVKDPVHVGLMNAVAPPYA